MQRQCIEQQFFSFFLPLHNADGIADRLRSHQVAFVELDATEISDSKCLFRLQTDQHLGPKTTHWTQTKHWSLENAKAQADFDIEERS